jgi:hypothetical protein
MLIFILNVKVPLSASLASARICLASKVEIKVARCNVLSSILNLIDLFLGAYVHK